MGILGTLESAAGSVAHGIADGAKDIAKGGREAVSDTFHGAVNAAKSISSGEIDAAKDVVTGGFDGARDLIRGAEHGDVLGGVAAAGSDLMHGEAAAIGASWNGGIKGVSSLLGGIDTGAHDLGGAAQKAYEAGVNGAAGAIGDVAGNGAARVFRTAANAVEAPIKQETEFTWGVAEGVVEGVGGAVKGIGSLVGDTYKFATDSHYRDGVVKAVEHGVTYAAEHPVAAAEEVGSVGKALATSIYQGGVQAAKHGDLAEYIGKGVGQVGLAVATTVFAPEADAGEAAGLAGDAAGGVSRTAGVLEDAGGGTAGAVEDTAGDAAKAAGDAGAGESRVVQLHSLDEFKAAHAPDTTYKFDGYSFTTDAQGRPIRAEGEVRLSAAGRDPDLQRGIGNGPDAADTDVGFHLIADQFNGPSGRLNIVPANGKPIPGDVESNLNGGAYKTDFEHPVKKLLEQGRKVEVKVEPEYKGDSSVRPDRIRASYRVDGGRWVVHEFVNKR